MLRENDSMISESETVAKIFNTYEVCSQGSN